MSVPSQSQGFPREGEPDPAARGTSPSSRSVEGRLVVMRVSPEILGSIGRPGAGAVFALHAPISACADGWRLVSHILELKPGGDGLLSMLLEKAD